MATLQDVTKAVELGKLKTIEGLVKEALDAGVPAEELLSGMIEAMGVVGDKFQKNEIFVPEMLVAAKTMQRAVGVLKPLLSADSVGNNGKYIIGTVKGDLHDIGKNLVALMVESAGFEVIDLGVDVPAEKFVEALRENPDCKIIALSALLTTTMDSMRECVKALIDSGLTANCKIMVGGAPITAEFAAEIGADAYTPDAGAAAKKAQELVG